MDTRKVIQYIPLRRQNPSPVLTSPLQLPNLAHQRVKLALTLDTLLYLSGILSEPVVILSFEDPSVLRVVIQLTWTLTPP